MLSNFTSICHEHISSSNDISYINRFSSRKTTIFQCLNFISLLLTRLSKLKMKYVNEIAIVLLVFFENISCENAKLTMDLLNSGFHRFESYVFDDL